MDRGRKGSAAIIIILILVIVVLVGVIVYFAMRSNNSPSSQAGVSNSNSNEAAATAPTTTPVSNAGTSPQPASSAATNSPSVNTSSNNKGVDTSAWQTESIHFAPDSICWTIKYPSTLSPIGANNGYSSDEEFLTSYPPGPSTTGVTLSADFNEPYSQVDSGQSFITSSGLNGNVQTNAAGSWRIFIQASEGGYNFVFVMNPYQGGQTPPYDLSTAEAMARSITLSCAVPASPQ